MDQNLAIDCIEVVENLSQKEKNKILSVLKRDDKLRVGQEQKISQLKQEINTIRKNGVLRAGDDQSKMCIRCRAPLGFLFNRGDICPACRFKVCAQCQEVMFNKSWLCKLCYKQRQLKWLTGEWAASFEQNPLRKWASGTDIRHGSMQVFSGATSIDIGEPESNRTNNNRSSKSAHNGILTSSDQDKQRVEYPKEADQHKLSQLFGVLRSRKPEETTKELQVRRVSTRKYSETDSDSSSSSDVEAPSVTESELDKTESPRSVESPKSRLEAVDEDLNESVESDRVGKHKVAYKSKQKTNEDTLQETVNAPIQDAERIVRPKVAQSSNRPKPYRSEKESDGSHTQTHPRKRERKKILPDQTIARELRIKAEEATKVSQSKSVDINLNDPSDNGLVGKRKVVSQTELNSKKLGDPYASRSHESLDKKLESQTEKAYIRKSHENIQVEGKSSKTVSPAIRHSAENLSPKIRNKVKHDIRRSHESLETAKEKDKSNQNIRQARSHEYLPTTVKLTDTQTISGQNIRDQLENDYKQTSVQKPVVDIEVTHASIHVSDVDKEINSEIDVEEDAEILKGQRAGSPYSFSMDSLPSSNPSPTLRRSIDSSIPESSDTDSLSKLSHHEFSGTESQAKEGSEDDFVVEEISKVRFQRISKKAAQMSVLGKIASSPKRPGSCEGVDRGQRKSQSRGGSGGKDNGDDNGELDPEIKSKYILKMAESPRMFAEAEPVVEEKIHPSKKQSNKAPNQIFKVEESEVKDEKSPIKVLVIDRPFSNSKRLNVPSFQLENINRSRSAVSSTGSEPRSAVDLSWFDEYAVDTKQTALRQVSGTSDQVFEDMQGSKDKPDSDTDSVEGMIDNMARPHLLVENLRRSTRPSEADSEGSFNITPISPFPPDTFETKMGTYTLTYMESDDNLDAVSTDDNLDAGSDVDATVEPSVEQFEKKVVIGRKEKQKLTARNSLDVLIAKQGNLLEADKDIVEIDTEFKEALKIADESHNVRLPATEFEIREKQPLIKPVLTQLPESVKQMRPQDIAAQLVKPSVKKDDEVDCSFEMIKPGLKMRIPAGRKDAEKSKVVGINMSNLGSCYDSARERVEIEKKQDNMLLTTDMKQSVHMSDTKDANSTDYDKSSISPHINEPEIQFRTVTGRKDKVNLCAQKSLDLLVFKQGEWVDLAAETVELDSELKTALESESFLAQVKLESFPLKAGLEQTVYKTDMTDAIRTNYDKVDGSLESSEPEIQTRTVAGRQDKSRLVAQKSLDLLVLKQGELVDFAVDSVNLDSELRMALEQNLQGSKSEALEFEDMLVMSDKEIDYLGMQLNTGSGSSAKKSDMVQSEQTYLDQKSTCMGTQTGQPAVLVNRQIALVKDNASESEESDILSVIDEEEEFSESSEQPEEARVNLAVAAELSPRHKTDEIDHVKEHVCKDKDQMNLDVAGTDVKLTDKVKIIQDKVEQINKSFESPGHEKYEGYDVKIHSKFKKLQERWNAIEKHEADLLDVDEITNLDNRQSKTVGILELESKSPSSTVPDCHSDGSAEDNKFNVKVDTDDRTQTAFIFSESANLPQDVERQTDTEVHTNDDFTDIVKRTAETLNISAESDYSGSIADEEPESDEDKTGNLSEERQSETYSVNDKDDSVAENLFEVQMRPKPGRSNAEIVSEEKVNKDIKETRETDNRFQTFRKDQTDQTVRHAKESDDWDTEICHSVADEYFESKINPDRHSISETSGICQSLTDLNTELDTSNFEGVVNGKICLSEYDMDKGQDLSIHEKLARCQSSGDESEMQLQNVAFHESVVACQSIAEGDSETFYAVQEDADRCISIDEKSFTEYGANTDNVLVDDSKIVTSEIRVSQRDGAYSQKEDTGETVHRPLVRLSKLRKGVKLPSPTVKHEFGELDRFESSVIEKQMSDMSIQGIQDKACLVNYDLADGLKDKETKYEEFRDSKKLTVLTSKENQEPVFPPEPQCFKVPNIPFKIESRLSSSSAPSSPDLSIDLPFTPKDSPQSDKISSHRMSPQTISEGSISQDDSGLASGGSRGTTPEHKRTDSGYSQSSLPSTLSTVTDRSTEDEEDIDKVLAKMKTPGGRGNLLSVAADSRESIASFYSDAGDIAYSKIPVTGEILFGLNYNYKTGMLEVHIKQCRDIAAVDAKRRRSDPLIGPLTVELAALEHLKYPYRFTVSLRYVKTYLLPDKTRGGKRKSKVKKHTLNPTFDEQLKYSISKSELENRTLWLTVWHNDRFGRNDFLGEVTINFDYYKFDDPSPKWYPLQERLDAQPTSMLTYKGDIVLSIRYVPADKVKTTEFKGKTKRDSGSGSGKGQLHVVVKEARNLTAVRSNGFSDPFCKGYLLPERHRSSKQKTAVVKKNCSPAWNHTFIFEDVSILELQERCLELTIWDYEKLTSNDFLGGTRLNLGTGLSQGKPVDWMDARGEEMTMWQAMLDRPNLWIDGTLILRPNMEKRKF